MENDFAIVTKDDHIHLEGINLGSDSFKEVISKARNFFLDKTSLINTLESQTNKEFIKQQFFRVNSPSNINEVDFEIFLQKLYISKMILASDYQNIYDFLYTYLTQFFSKFQSIRLGITPTIPLYFSYISHELWFESIADAIKEILRNTKNKKIEIVIETKREDLVQIESIEVLFNYLDFFIKTLKDKTPQIQISLSLSGNEEKYPIIKNSKMLNRYLRYLGLRDNFPDLGVSIHSLESVCDQLNPKTSELETLLDTFDEKQIYNVNFIHLCQLTNATDKVDLLKKLKSRNDKIIVCPTSNDYLKNPFILDHPDILELILELNIDLGLGSDDPGAFETFDIEDEYKNLKSRIFRKYTDPSNIFKKLLCKLHG